MSEPTFREIAPGSLEAHERLQADVKRLLGENERLRAGWRPIETAPRDGTWILTYGADTPISDGYLLDWYVPDDGWNGNPTHWRPLPTPPARSAT